jgi:hypothetical protein
MPPFTVNATRLDPYKNFKFRVVWDGRAVAGVSRVSALTRTTEVVTHREGGDPSSSRKMPGRTEFAPVVFERAGDARPGVRALGEQGLARRRVEGRGDVAEGFPEGPAARGLQRGRAARHRYNIFRCWVSEFKALPDWTRTATR